MTDSSRAGGDRLQSASPAMVGKIRSRLVLPTILFMLLSSLDRVNISFASLRMNAELGLTPSQYGFGAGILFVGFLTGQFPSVLLLQRIGMRRWLAACTLLWGACAASTAFIHSAQAFYVLRVILGFAEGGLAPGIVIYLSQFASERERAATFALPMVAVPISVVVAGPISGWLLGMDGAFGLSPWRWMFIAEALPTLAFGLFALFYFPNTPAQADWLSDDEKGWLAANAANRAETAQRNDWRVLARPLVWVSAVLWFCLLSGSYGIIFWLPQMVKSLTSLSPLQVGLVTALPWLGNVVGIYLNASHSDRTGERFWHIAIPAAVCAAAILTAGHLGASLGGLIALLVAGTALGAAQGAFWALPTRMFTPATFAVGAVGINLVGSSGGLVVPYVVGLLRQASGGFGAPTLLLAGLLLTAAVIVIGVRLVVRDPALTGR